METQEQDWDELVHTTAKRYDTGKIYIYDYVPRLKIIASAVRELRGKRVLDLGCGARFNLDDNDGTQYQPWYCRLLHEAGADVLGIDIQPNDSEIFPHKQMDLLKDNALDELKSESYDAINNSAFIGSDYVEGNVVDFTSPYAIRIVRERSQEFRNLIAKSLHGKAVCLLMNELETEALRIRMEVGRLLREGGVYTYLFSVYRKENGQLIKQKQKLI